MTINSNKYGKKDDGDEIDVMLPFMSLLLIIIPVLISNIAFYHFWTVGINIPGSSNEDPDQKEKLKPSKEINYIMQITIKGNDSTLELINEDTGETLQTDKVLASSDEGKEVENKIIEHRTKHIKIDSLLVNVDPEVKYDRIVKLLTKFKKTEKISEKHKDLILVLLPKGIGILDS